MINDVFMPVFKLLYGYAFAFLLVVCIIIYFWLLINYNKYKKSDYGKASGNGFFKTIFSKGNYGEYLIFRFLEKLQIEKKLLTNIYVPKQDSTTTEIDLLMICKYGIYVFESKNYSGWIFGDEKSKMWTQSLKGGKKNKFFNPIWQNKGHISALSKLLSDVGTNTFYSYIVFSERCELKKISVTANNIILVKRNELSKALVNDFNTREDIFSEEQVNNLYKLLKKYTYVDDFQKQKHIENIRDKQ